MNTNNQTVTTLACIPDDNEATLRSYPLEVSPLSDEDGGGFQALYKPLARSVVGYGSTPTEAIADLEDASTVFLDVLAETEHALQKLEPSKDRGEYSGKFNVRVAKSLHAELVRLAEREGTSLNSIVQTLLTAGVTNLTQGFQSRAREDRIDLVTSLH